MRRLVPSPENSPDIIKANMNYFEQSFHSITHKHGKDRIAVFLAEKKFPSRENPIGSLTVQIKGKDDWDIIQRSRKKGGRYLFLNVVSNVNKSASRNGANKESLRKEWEYNQVEDWFEKTFTWN